MSVDRRKSVVVQQYGEQVHEQQVVENVNLEHRETVYKISQLIWLLFGGLEALIGLRVILMLIGANSGNWFATLVYQLSDLFLWPFHDLIANPSFQNMTWEFTSMVAMIVYALLGWLLVRLTWVLFDRTPSTQVTTYERQRH